ncbi:PHB depolymerase family esterase [Candidimonas sp. SYP-B2681]|uniref:extracellular catalytic domain type 1 short-chain-length polyhydroxyalkanoate depolymerase n=1 Tax=Candidimonas sp. SYP-B2681 TaxID=2497686 RepID=UPI000F89095A|nr:PHB depolymerase family esterase [Candidimonas sp. SYP-B2681]RTZ40027.1 PHB depolymerase family esterase [Candidimonas sp. SYP-B2681]
MAKKLSNLFFSTVKRIGRMQRQALKLTIRPPVKRAKAKVVKTAKAKSAKPVKRARATTTRLPSGQVPAGSGTWQNLNFKTLPSSTELLGRLAYSLYRPAIQPTAGMPLVVMLHGCQQTAYEMAMGSRMNKLADSKGFVVLYPQQSKRVQAMRCWRWFQPDGPHGCAEADAIADLASDIVARYKLDGSKVYVAGLSAGAGMAALAALRRPDVFAAVAMHSGAVLGEAHNAATGLQAMRRGTLKDPLSLTPQILNGHVRFPGMPAMILHGQQDRVVAPRNARQLTQQFVHINWQLTNDPLVPTTGIPRRSVSALGLVDPPPRKGVMAAGTEREYLREDYIRGRKPIVRLCLIKSVGHAWSGGDGKLKFHAKDGPKASAVIWQFFTMHQRLL